MTVRGPGPANGTVFATPAPLTGVSLGSESDVRWLEVIDNRAIGRVGATSEIVASTDDGLTYTTLADVGLGSIIGILPCSDGEWLFVTGQDGPTGGIWRSDGWVADPATATFAKVSAPTDEAHFLRQKLTH